MTQATGRIGPVLVEQLVLAGFEVTALTRGSTKHDFPETVAVKIVDYDSLASVTEALTGQDAVVSALGHGPGLAGLQSILLEAAVNAKVKRIIPSEYGSDTRNAKAGSLPFYQKKVKAQGAFEQAAATGSITYTIICTGPFLDWGISSGFLVDMKAKSAQLYDGGNNLFSATTVANIGKAVSGVLKNLEQTKNRAAYVQGIAIFQKTLVEMCKKATGPAGWKEQQVSIQDLLDQGFAELKKDKPDPIISSRNFLIAAVFGEGYGSQFQKLDNDLLGLKGMDEAEVQAIVDGLAKQ
ncbi:Uu.00g139240.m01.CDS01 [Anthostomella pinea]|uniref:Uu.00g139240.m01.CDS01 n=1 Tax=Anthostomella pinea TaxID=933095 RepID=A0AAI8YL54_9PEZI|nr:Uu.00g139240.m01.CDS01 [Anthostomella pinea]